MYVVAETEAALEDLRETIAYLNYRTGSKRAGADLLDAYEKLVGILEQTPFAFPLAVDSVVGSLGYRWARVRSYIVLYMVNEADEMVVIERVEHESRNWRALLG